MVKTFHNCPKNDLSSGCRCLQDSFNFGTGCRKASMAWPRWSTDGDKKATFLSSVMVQVLFCPVTSISSI